MLPGYYTFETSLINFFLRKTVSKIVPKSMCQYLFSEGLKNVRLTDSYSGGDVKKALFGNKAFLLSYYFRVFKERKHSGSDGRPKRRTS